MGTSINASPPGISDVRKAMAPTSSDASNRNAVEQFFRAKGASPRKADTFAAGGSVNVTLSGVPHSAPTVTAFSWGLTIAIPTLPRSSTGTTPDDAGATDVVTDSVLKPSIV